MQLSPLQEGYILHVFCNVIILENLMSYDRGKFGHPGNLEDQIRTEE